MYIDLDFLVKLLGGGLFAGLFVYIIQSIVSWLKYQIDQYRITELLKVSKEKFPIGRRTTNQIAKECNLTPNRVEYIGHTSKKIKIVYKHDGNSNFWELNKKL